MRKEILLFNKQFKTNSTYPFLDRQRSVTHDQRHVARDLCPKNISLAIVKPNRGVNRMTSWSSAFITFTPSNLRNLRWCQQVLEPATFFTLVRTDVMMNNREAEVSSMAVRGGFDRFLMTTWMACQNPSWYKTVKRSRRRRTKQGIILPLYQHALVMPSCGYRPRKRSLSGGETV